MTFLGGFGRYIEEIITCLRCELLLGYKSLVPVSPQIIREKEAFLTPSLTKEYTPHTQSKPITTNITIPAFKYFLQAAESIKNSLSMQPPQPSAPYKTQVHNPPL